LITAITGNAKTQLTQQEIVYLKTSIIGNSYSDSNALFGQIFASLSFQPDGATNLTDYLLQIRQDISQSAAQIGVTQSYIDACNKEMAKIKSFLEFFGTVSPDGQTFTFSSDSMFCKLYSGLSGDFNTLKPGYISGAGSNEISYYASQLQTVESTFRSIISDANDIKNNYTPSDTY
jgi:hypothetical protein